MDLLNHAELFPSLFDWNGPITSDRLVSAIEHLNIRPPADLIYLWETTGGGTIFESEEILSPIKNHGNTEDVHAVSEWHYKSGLPKQFVVFATGCFLSAVSRIDSTYVSLDTETYDVEKQYNTLDQWYNNTLFDEFASRYGLR